MLKPLLVLSCGLAAATCLGAAATTADGSHYHLAREVPIPGDEGWDYLNFDPGSARLFVSHGTRVQVVETSGFTVAGEVADTPGVHGIALAPDLGRGYVSAGRADSIVVFDLRSLARLTTIMATGGNPDAILYDPFSRRVFTFNGRGRNATAIDTARNVVVGTIPLDAKPEFAVTDAAGHLYVNLEDRNSLAVIDPVTLKVLETWPLTGCEEPSGLALDRAHARLFSVCGNRVMVVVDAKSGHVLATLPIGARVDAAAFDSGRGLAFASCGDGTMTVVQEDDPQRFRVVATIKTRPGARTLTLDEATHRVFSVTASLGPPPPGQTPARPSIEPGSFRLLVLEP
jgi:DNA-binding beta-propeller fold protein YncE